MTNKIIGVNKQYGELMRTIFVVLVTPLLGLLCLFFLRETYYEQKAVREQQNLILVELGKIKEKEINVEKKVDEFKKDLNNSLNKTNLAVNTNSRDIMEIWKTVDKN